MAVTQIEGSRQIRFSGNMSMASNKITNLATPTGANDAVNKQYVDSIATGLSDFKQSVRVASVANVNISAAPAAIDGLTLDVDNRVLLKDQTDASENGLYIFNDVGNAMTRSGDADSSEEVTTGMFVFVEEGSTNDNTGWVLATNMDIVLGTTNLSFAKFTAVNLNSSTLAGAGLAPNGSAIDVGANDASILVTADGINVQIDGSTLSTSGSGLKIPTGGITDNELAANAVTTVKITDANVTTAKLANNAVTTVKITDANVTTEKLAANAVTTVKITDANVTTEKLANNAVTTVKITDANVTTEKLADSAVTNAKINDNAVTAGKLANGAVGSTQLADNSVITTKIANNAVTMIKLVAGQSAQMIVCDGSGVPTYVDMTGDVTTDNAGITAIGNSKVLTAMINNSAVTTGKIADANVTTGKIADANVTTGKIADSNVTTGKIANDAVTTVKIADNNVTLAKLENGSDARIIICDGTGDPTYVDVSGDVTIDNTGVTTIGNLKVVTGMLNNSAVTTAKIADGNVTTIKIADSNVTTAKIANDAVTTAKLDNDAVTTIKITDLNVTTAKINDSAVTTAKIADNNVTTAKILDSNVTTAKINDSAVTTAKIADSNVTTAKIADSNVTTAKINDAAVTNVKLGSDSVTGAKLALVKQARTNSGNTQWVLSSAPHDDAHLLLFKNGLLLTVTEDYTRSGDTVELTSAPENSDSLTAVYQVS